MRLHEQIALLEKQRKILFLLEVILLPVGIVTVFAGVILSRVVEMMLVVGGILILSLILYLSFHCGSFKEMYKVTFLQGLLTEMFEQVDYRWNYGFSSEEVQRLGLVRLGNRFHSEDYLQATYKGVRFEQADVTIRHVSGSGKNRTTTTYFKGRMFKFHTTIKKVVDVQVFSETFHYRARPAEGFKMHKVELEELEFNNQFDVFSFDEVEAFYVLTPPMMERIKFLREKYGNVAFHFKPNEVYVAFNCQRDAFDPVITRKISYPQERARMEEDVSDIIHIIEAMGLEVME